ncbi:MAG: peptide chain release factor N(5)-glutamine methyltransferase [Pseudomonadota bacterium]|nr:peptide chain release factor N(5)-glutamine methyltransferase [Pseudomonadota bacterium]
MEETNHVTISELLHEGCARLADNSDSARLDAEILLEHVLKKARVTFYTRGADPVVADAGKHFLQLVEQRQHGRPVAQLIGRREFWSMPLEVTTDTLIPRPETELLVERGLVRIKPQSTASVLELGTGSGAIALAIARERSAAAITATDVSEVALKVARGNARRLNIDGICWQQGPWFEPVRESCFDIILSNPPYVATTLNGCSDAAVMHEPSIALFAGPDGLDAIRSIIGRADAHLHAGGWLLLEHANDQAKVVRSLLADLEFSSIATYRDLSGQQRVTEGCWKQATAGSAIGGEGDSYD